MFTFCITRGTKTRGALSLIANMTDPRVQCRNETTHVPQVWRFPEQNVKVCSTTAMMSFQSHQVVDNGTSFSIVRNGTFYTRHRIQSLRAGTEPFADVFWLCDDDNQVKVTLKTNWTGIRTPIILIGQVTIISPPPFKKTPVKRSTHKAKSASRSCEVPVCMP